MKGYQTPERRVAAILNLNRPFKRLGAREYLSLLIRRILGGCASVFALLFGLTPGAKFQWHYFCLAVQRGHFREALSPFEISRYFELACFDAAFERRAGGRWLDVSSPRSFLVAALHLGEFDRAVLINPDGHDLAQTKFFLGPEVRGLKLQYQPVTISELNERSASFDLITSISVVEHIPDDGDRVALQKMWSLLAPNGSLILSVPVAKSGFLEFTNYDEYQLHQADDSGLVFGQRFYDLEALQGRIFSLLGEPEQMHIFGEKEPGYFFSNREFKVGNPHYVRSAEAWRAFRHYRYWKSMASLPGLGVAVMRFKKSSQAKFLSPVSLS